MLSTAVTQLETIIEVNKKDVSTVLAQAVEIGISKLWTETILNLYLSKKITRKKAIRSVGLDLVNLADKQNKIVQEDIKWGLSNGQSSL